MKCPRSRSKDIISIELRIYCQMDLDSCMSLRLAITDTALTSVYEEGFGPFAVHRERAHAISLWPQLIDSLFDTARLHEWEEVYEQLGVLDGESWTLLIGLSDGRFCNYSGSNAEPPYWSALVRILLPFTRAIQPSDDHLPYQGIALRSLERTDGIRSKIRTLDDLYHVLRACWSVQTAHPETRSRWLADDPSYGQSAITAMMVHDLFGGTIHKNHVSDGTTHYFNRIEGIYVDLVREQYDLYDTPVSYEPNTPVPRGNCGRNRDTAERYQTLRKEVADYLRSTVEAEFG